MSITDELREWAVENLIPKWAERLIAIADRIDAEHERVVRERRRSCVYYDPERHYCSCHDFNVSGYVELPKDADDEYIHEHDKVDWRDHAGTWHENATVVAVCSDGCYVMDGTVFHVHKSDIRHHHAPTVEDVLTEMFAKAIERGELTNGAAQTIAEYAAKLRLTEGEDE